jgi:hypothetical protein
MKYAIEMGSGAMIHIPSFRKIESFVQKLTAEGMRIEIRRQQGDLISLLYFLESCIQEHINA